MNSTTPTSSNLSESTMLFRTKFLEVGCFLTGGTIVITLIARYFAQAFPLNLFLTNLFFGFTVFSNGLFVRKFKNILWPSAIFLLALLLIGANAGISYGGFYAPAVISVALCPLFAGFLGGRLFSASVLLATLTTLLFLYFTGKNGVFEVKDPNMELSRLIVYVAISIGLFFTGLSMEIARKYAENELSHKELQIRAILESSPVGKIVTDQNFQILMMNQRAKNVLSALNISEPFEKFFSDLKSGLPTSNPVLTFTDQGESKRIRFHLLDFSFNSTTEKSILINMIDETESHKNEIMQKALTNQSKMAALGEMASGIAHEINNPLAIIVGKCAVLIKNIQKNSYDQPRIIAEIEKIVMTSGRIAKIVSGLLNFAREGQIDSFTPTNLNSLIENTLSLCSERFLFGGVHLTCQNHASADLMIDCHPSQISQVLINLLNNAYDELMNNPNMIDKSKWVRVEVWAKESFVEIHVIDAGLGISQAVREKIFNPFFTTKPVGSGTGLGLSISKGLIEKHGGDLTYSLDPKNNLNTCFSIKLPQKA